MGRITLDLDDETESKMREAAKAAGMSPSRWVVGLIKERTTAAWPESIARLAGAWVDFPTAEELRAGQSEDLPRESS